LSSAQQLLRSIPTRRSSDLHFRRYSLEELELLFHRQHSGTVCFSSYFNTRLYPLVWLARKWSKIRQGIRRQPVIQSDFDAFRTGLFDRFLFAVMSGERHALSSRQKLSRGVSIVLHWKAE